LLLLWRLVVDAQHVVALPPELVVVRSQVHLLPMRLQVSILEYEREFVLLDQ
jgi:hypothetical protein